MRDDGNTAREHAGSRWFKAAKRLVSRPGGKVRPNRAVIGLALGGGFARGIAHVGVLRVLEQHGVPISAIAGVSAGAIVAAAYASGASPNEIESVARAMRFRDVARWSISRLGLAGSERMAGFLDRLLKAHTFEQMRIPLAVVATDLSTGKPAVFREHGSVVVPIRASCSYPGLFRPVTMGTRCLVDGAMSMEMPAEPLRQMGATHVISVALPMPSECGDPGNLFSVVNRCFQILQSRTEREWRRHSNLVIEPDVCNIPWDGFTNAHKLVEAGERAALAALPRIRSWLPCEERPGAPGLLGSPTPAGA